MKTMLNAEATNLPDGLEMMLVCTDPGIAGKQMADRLGIPHITPTRCKAWRQEPLLRDARFDAITVA